MKKSILLYTALCTGLHYANGQLTNSSGGYIVQSGSYLVMQNTDLVNNGTLNASAGSVRFSGTSNNSISGTSSPSFYTLEINKNTGNQLTLQHNIAVSNYIDFQSGLIELSGNNIVLNGAAYLNNENETSRITGITGGYVQATATLNAPSAANPGNLGAVVTSAQNLGSTVIRRGHVSQQNINGAGSSIYRYFDVIPTTTPSAFDVRLNYFDAELNGLTESTLEIWRSPDALHWYDQGHTGRDATGNYVIYSGITQFSQRWTLSTVDNVLPLTLLSFRASCSGNAVALNWTLAETSTSHTCEVQRSNNGVQWQTIATLPTGSGSSYSYTDQLGNAHYVYRLKVYGADDKTSYSEIKSSGCAVTNSNAFIYPNPATSYLQLQFNNLPGKALEVMVYSNSGQLLLKKNIITTGTADSYVLPLTDLPAGMYHVTIQADGYKKTLPFVKQ
jgi:hypothetical protein